MVSLVNMSDESIQNINDITTNFESLRVAALKRASKLSGSINSVTIGPDSSPEKDNNSIENIENEINNCNIDVLKKNPEPSQPPKQNASSRSTITFSIKKILLENEIQRREEVRKAIEKKKQDMEKTEKALQEEMAILREILVTKREREEAAELERLEAEEEKLAQQNEIKRKHEQQLHAQRLQERKERFEREAEEHRKLKELEAVIEKMKSKFSGRCRDIKLLSKMCNDKNAANIIFNSILNTLKELSNQLESICEKARKGDLTPTDVAIGEQILQQTDKVFQYCKTEISQIDARYEEAIAKRKQEMEAAEAYAQAEAAKIQTQIQISEQNQPVPENKSNVDNVNSMNARLPETPPNETTLQTNEAGATTTDSSSVETVIEESDTYPDHESLQIYVRARTFLDSYTALYHNFVRSPATKQFRFDCQKAINIPINTISSVSGAHLKEKYEKLKFLLEGKASPNVNEHPEGPAFCKNLLAKNIVNQGETLVSSKPEMAFGIAAVIAALCCDFPDLLELLLAHFRTICPYIIPVFLPRIQDQSNEDYYKSLGYKYIDGNVEKHDKFLNRMSGIMRLYASIIVARLRKNGPQKHPHGLNNAWRWLAATLNFIPKPEHVDVTATLILDMLEVCGSSLWQAFPKQFPKLLKLLIEQYHPQVQGHEGICGGPMTRLQKFLEDCISQNSIPEPVGQLPMAVW
ncbi:nucleoporin Gle1 [Chelonus insularis]|uniref:nucleoporin Gle1 n=1 Tax=Chelonus insularis TaxID=460826 RepID=UPI001589873A|nr:nucleoporin Gle1 [Chelonus insularis]